MQIGDSVVYKLVQWIKRLPFYGELPLEVCFLFFFNQFRPPPFSRLKPFHTYPVCRPNNPVAGDRINAFHIRPIWVRQKLQKKIIYRVDKRWPARNWSAVRTFPYNYTHQTVTFCRCVSHKSSIQLVDHRGHPITSSRMYAWRFSYSAIHLCTG